MEDEDGERGTVGEEGSHSLICHPLTVTDINLLVIGDRYMLCYLARQVIFTRERISWCTITKSREPSILTQHRLLKLAVSYCRNQGTREL